MAQTNLSFAKIATVGTSNLVPGRIYFETTTGLIKVAKTTTDVDAFGGVRKATWDNNSQHLTITNANGSVIDLDLSDVASASEVSAAIANKVNCTGTLALDKIVLGGGEKNIKSSVYGITDKVTDDEQSIPTSKAVLNKINELNLSALTFIGEVKSDAEFPTTGVIGDTYYITTVEPFVAGSLGTLSNGDMIICKTNSSTKNYDNWVAVQGNWTVEKGTVNLSWGGTTTLATIGGVDIQAKLPANPNTDSSTTKAGHYIPSKDAVLTAAAGTQIDFGNSVITGIEKDEKGHITGIISSKLPDKPSIPNVSVTGGEATSKQYVSAISTNGHGITVTKATLPTLNDLGGITPGNVDTKIATHAGVIAKTEALGHIKAKPNANITGANGVTGKKYLVETTVDGTAFVDVPWTEGPDTKMSKVTFNASETVDKVLTVDTVDVIKNITTIATSSDGMNAVGTFNAVTVPTKKYVDSLWVWATFE